MKKLSLLLLFIGLSMANTNFAHTIEIKNDTKKDITVHLYGKNNKILKELKNIKAKSTKKVTLTANIQKVKWSGFFNKTNISKKTKRQRISEKGFLKKSKTTYDKPIKMRLTGGKITFKTKKNAVKAYYTKGDKTYRLKKAGTGNIIKVKNNSSFSILVVLRGKNGKLLKIFKKIRRGKTEKVKLYGNVQSIMVRPTSVYHRSQRIFTKTEYKPGLLKSYEDPIEMRLTGGTITIIKIKMQRAIIKASYKKGDKKYRLTN